MNCVLIGYRGTGKSTIGKILSRKLNFPYVNLDAEIVKKAGMPIPEIVEKHSWEHFRDLEEEVVAEAAARDGRVLDTGGGVITRPRNIENLRRTGVVFLLEATIEDIVSRIGSDTQRPSLTGKKSFTEEVAEVLEERRPLYRKTAHFIIDTSRLSAEEAAAEIAERFLNLAGP